MFAIYWSPFCISFFTFHFRIVICKRPTSTRSVFEDVDKDTKASPESQFDSLEETFPWPKSEPSPFSSNPAMYEKEEVGITVTILSAGYSIFFLCFKDWDHPELLLYPIFVCLVLLLIFNVCLIHIPAWRLPC